MTDAGHRRLTFFGSPAAAVTVLERVVAAGHHVVGAVTQPPRRRGRGGGLSPTAVEEWAVRNAIPVVHSPTEAERWCEESDLGVVVAYGRLIPARLLEMCPMLNVHFSLLPRWRGAAPVERAILAGDAMTGVSIMELESTLDTGPTYAVRQAPIRDDDTAAILTERLAVLGADELVKVLAEDTPEKTPQQGDVSYAEKIAPEECVIDWTRDSVSIVRQIRALDSWCWAGDRRLKVRSCSFVGPTDSDANGPATGATAGTVTDEGCVTTGDGLLRLGRVKPEGKREMDASEWLSGARQRGAVVLSSTSSVR